jgi:hypothetical protein
MKTEAFKVLEDSQIDENQTSIPIGGGEGGNSPGKPHRFTFNIGCFNDGLRSSFCTHLLV